MQWLARHRRLALAIICGFWTGLIFLGLVLPRVPFLYWPWSGEQSFEDKLRIDGRHTKARPDFVFVGIDQASLQMNDPKSRGLGQEEIAGNRALELMSAKPFPWSREIWALFLDKVFAAGARLVIFDLVFNSSNEGDEAFHAALDRYRDRVVIGANIDVVDRERQLTRNLILPNDVLIPSPGNEQSPSRDDRVGFVNFFPDSDGKTREAVFRLSDGVGVVFSFAARGLAKLGHEREVPQDFQSHAIRFGPASAYEPVELWKIFFPRSWEANFERTSFFKDKVIIVGASSQIGHDVVNTPIDANMRGPALHLHTMAAALGREYLSRTPPALRYGLILAAGLGAWGLISFVRRPVVALPGLLLLGLAYLVAARVSYDTRGFFLLTVPVLAAFLLSGICSLGFDYALERLEKLRTRRTLERYVSRNLVKEILENPDSYYHSLLGVRVPATMLFSDLIGFTTLAEKADPEELVRQLNEYLTKMTTVVFENGGTLDKFIGDAIMAVWGNVRSLGVAEDAKSAVRTAYGMRCALRKLNDGWKEEGRMGLGMGIGINQGEVIVGNIGSQERMDPTVIGDAVNLASRLEALTRTYAVDILVGPTAAELVRDEFRLRSVARVQVKGKTEPVEVCTILGPKGGDILDPELLKWMQSYEEGIVRFRDREFSKAKILFSRFLEFYPDDFLAKMYLERALEYEQQPPDEAWNAVEVFKKK